MSSINKLYGVSSGKTYYACKKNCPICIEWKKPTNIWKSLTFFPYHCAGCNFAGYPDDFHIISDNTFVCLKCKDKYYSFLNKLLKKK